MCGILFVIIERQTQWNLKCIRFVHDVLFLWLAACCCYSTVHNAMLTTSLICMHVPCTHRYFLFPPFFITCCNLFSWNNQKLIKLSPIYIYSSCLTYHMTGCLCLLLLQLLLLLLMFLEIFYISGMCRLLLIRPLFWFFDACLRQYSAWTICIHRMAPSLLAHKSI